MGSTIHQFHPPLISSYLYHAQGTETEAYHGHVEGAIVAGERAAREVLAAWEW